MPIEQEIRNKVVTLSGLTQAQVQLMRSLQGTSTPYINITKVSGVRESVSGGATGTVQSRIQVSAYATDYVTAKTKANLCIPLQDYTSASVAKIMLDNEVDIYDDDTKIFSTNLDFIVQYYE